MRGSVLQQFGFSLEEDLQSFGGSVDPLFDRFSPSTRSQYHSPKVLLLRVTNEPKPSNLEHVGHLDYLKR
jgi:hypothetical protein